MTSINKHWFISCATETVWIHIKQSFTHRCRDVLDPVHTTPFSNKNDTVLFRFQKRFASTLIVSVWFSPVHTTTRIRIENALEPYILLYSPSILSPLLSPQQIKVVPLRWSSSWSCSDWISLVLADFDRVVFIIIVPPKAGKLRSFIIFCSLLEKSKK